MSKRCPACGSGGTEYLEHLYALRRAELLGTARAMLEQPPDALSNQARRRDAEHMVAVLEDGMASEVGERT